MRVALVHDYLSQDGGAERVLKALAEMYSEAPIFVLFYDKERMPAYFQQRELRPTFLQYLPFGDYRWSLPLMPFATERHNLSDFDVIISSTSAFAKGLLTGPETLHLSYCHTPTRFLWTDTHSYIEELNYNRLIKSLLPPLISRLRAWDQMSSQRVDHFIANSENVRRRIQKYYRREAEVIYPPVDTHLFQISPNQEDYYLIGGRLVSYKRYDLVIKVFNRLGWPLKIFGEGPAEEKLKEMAGPNIEFLGKVSEEEKAALCSKCLAFIHPQVEDFGITAVEAMAAGRPVIAYAGGGALETVVEGVTGKFFGEQSWESLFDTLLHFNPLAFEPEKIRQHSLQFNVENFKQKIAAFVHNQWEVFRKGWKQLSLIR